MTVDSMKKSFYRDGLHTGRIDTESKHTTGNIAIGQRTAFDQVWAGLTEDEQSMISWSDALNCFRLGYEDGIAVERGEPTENEQYL